MRAFHILRLLVAVAAATVSAVVLARYVPLLHPTLFIGYALALGAANGWSAVGTWRLNGAAIGFSYTLYVANLYGAIIGWFFFNVNRELTDSGAAGLAIQLCLAVGFLFLLPIMSRFGVDDPPAIRRGVMVGLLFFVALAFASMVTLAHGMASQ